MPVQQSQSFRLRCLKGVCVRVTCHLHFWQNGRGLSRATALTRRWNGHRIRVSTESLKKKILPPLLPEFELATFRLPAELYRPSVTQLFSAVCCFFSFFTNLSVLTFLFLLLLLLYHCLLLLLLLLASSSAPLLLLHQPQSSCSFCSVTEFSEGRFCHSCFAELPMPAPDGDHLVNPKAVRGSVDRGDQLIKILRGSCNSLIHKHKRLKRTLSNVTERYLI